MSREENSGNVVLEEFLAPGKRPGAYDPSIVAESVNNANIWSNTVNPVSGATFDGHVRASSGSKEPLVLALRNIEG
jgi:hypothetical protein